MRRPALGPLAAAAAASTAAGLPVFLVGALAVQVRAGLHFDQSRLGFAVAAYYAAAAVGSVPFGRSAERLGAGRQLRLTALTAALAALGVAVTRNWLELGGALILGGLASSATQTAANLLLARAVPPERQGMAFGIKQSSVPLSNLLAGLAVPGIALTVGWRWALVTAAAGALVTAALVPLTPTPPRALRAGEAVARRADFAAARARRRLPLLVLGIGFGFGVGASTNLGIYLVESGVASGLSKADAGLVAALCGAFSLAVRLTTGWRADRRGRRHLPVVAAMIALGVGGYVLLATGVPALFVAGALIAYGAGWGWNGLFNFAVVRTHPDAPAEATGITQAAGRIGSVIGPITFGLVTAHGQISRGWIVSAGAGAIAALTILWGRRLLMARRAEDQAVEDEAAEDQAGEAERRPGPQPGRASPGLSRGPDMMGP